MKGKFIKECTKYSNLRPNFILLKTKTDVHLKPYQITGPNIRTMTIDKFISKYSNHPVLFVGTGISLRYLNGSFTWDNLLKHIAYELSGDTEYYLDTKAACQEDGQCNFQKLASAIEQDFNQALLKDRNGKFKSINDIFYENMHSNLNISRFKIYISKLFSELDIKDTMLDEIAEFKHAQKNISSVITTNYDSFIERIFDFEKLTGNDILLGKPYGSIYKIHGCFDAPDKIIVTEDDYLKFEKEYELILVQLLTLLTQHPIIFLGYGATDNHIKKVLKTIFTYVDPKSELATRICSNFLLVEYDKGNLDNTIAEYEIDLGGSSTCRINKLKTDDYLTLYKTLSEIKLPISATELRKVQSVVSEICSGGGIKIEIPKDLDSLKNSDKTLTIGSSQMPSYQYETAAELMANYFKIIEASDHQILALIDKYRIHSQQYFPIFAFSSFNANIQSTERLKNQQIANVEKSVKGVSKNRQKAYSSIDDILTDTDIPETYKTNVILWNVVNKHVAVELLGDFLKTVEDKYTTNYRRLLCVYDLVRYQ